MIAAAFFALAVLFVPGIAGAATTPRWALAAVVLPLLIPAGRMRFTSAHLFGLLFLGYAAISITWSHHWDGLHALIQLVVIAEAFVLGSRLDDLRPAIIGCGLGIWVSSLVILVGIDVPHAVGSINPAGLFANSNSMGEIAGLVLVVAIVHRLWWLVPGILPAFVMAGCRGAFVGVACAFAVWLWGKSRGTAIALCAIGIAAVVALAGSSSAQQRLEMWSDIVPHMTWMGHGLGSFHSLFPLYTTTIDTTVARPEHLHNDWLEYAFETGAGAILLLAFLWCSRSIALAALVGMACFGFPTHVAATAVLGGLVAGHAVRGRNALRDDLLLCRISLGALHARAMGSGARRDAAGGSGLPAQL